MLKTFGTVPGSLKGGRPLNCGRWRPGPTWSAVGPALNGGAQEGAGGRCRPLTPPCVLSSCKDTSHWTQGPPQSSMTSVELITSVKTISK